MEDWHEQEISAWLHVSSTRSSASPHSQTSHVFTHPPSKVHWWWWLCFFLKTHTHTHTWDIIKRINLYKIWVHKVSHDVPDIPNTGWLSALHFTPLSNHYHIHFISLCSGLEKSCNTICRVSGDLYKCPHNKNTPEINIQWNLLTVKQNDSDPNGKRRRYVDKTV